MKWTQPLRRGALVATAASLALLSGCVSGGSDTKPSASDGPVTITWWHIQTGDPTKAVWQSIADEYTALHPNVKIVQTALANEDFKAKLATAMQAGDPPDIFHSWGGATLAEYGKAGLIQDLSPSLKGAWGDSFSPAALAMNTDHGKAYAVPFSLSGVGLWYNKALFEKAGIATPPATWQEFLAAVDKLKAAGITPISLGNKEKWPGMYWYTYLALRAGGQKEFEAAAKRTASFDTPAFVTAGERLKELIDAGAFGRAFQGMDYGAQEVSMATGKAAMELMGDWSPAVQVASDPGKKGLGKDLGYFTFPALPGGAGDPADMLAGTGSYAVGKKAPKEAVDFLKFFTSKENESKFAAKGLFLTTVKGSETSVTDTNLRAVQQSLLQAPYLQNFYDQVLPQGVAVPLVDSITGLFSGSKTPHQVAADIEAAAKQTIG